MPKKTSPEKNSPVRTSAVKTSPAKKSRAEKTRAARGGLGDLVARSEQLAKERAEELVSYVRRRKERIAEDLYEMGKALRELREQKLYAALGYSSFDALLEGRALVGRETARQLIAVVDSQIPASKAAEFGLKKAYALTRLVTRTEEKDSVPWLVEHDAVIDGVPVSRASAEHLVAAASRRVPKRGHLRADDRRAATAAAKVQALLRRQGAKGAVARAGRARVSIELSIEDAERLVAR